MKIVQIYCCGFFGYFKSAREFIQLKLIEVAKKRIFDRDKSVSDVAYSLGFKYRQHFIRVLSNMLE